ncbi:MAG: YncE family protein [Deltaproteobacteria bacterium]|nr:YncE family protein [Deltaproteobacteria bacterium]
MKLFRILCVVFLLSLFGCAATPLQKKPLLSPAGGQALLTVYLSTSGAAEHVGKIQIDELAVEVDGAWIGLALPPVTIDYQRQKGRQMLLGAAVAPLGVHRRLRLRVSGLSGSDKEQEFIVRLSGPLELLKGESKCLFLDWQMLAERPGRRQLTPRFSAWGQGQALGGELLYVACREIDTVYIVRMDSNEVVAAFSVPGPLADIRVLAAPRRLYILSTGRRSIYVYDCLNARLIDQIALPGSIAPQHMVLSPDGQYAFVSDAAAGAIFKVDLSEGNLVAQTRTGHRPQRLIYIDEGLGRLAIAAPRSHQVFILNAADLRIQRIIPVGSRPSGLLYFADALYVAETGSRSVAVYNLQTGKQSATIAVGLAPDYLLSVDRNSAYVSNSGEGSLMVLYAGQNTAFKRIATAQNPTEMIFSQRRRLLYIESPKMRTVTVVDQVSENILKQIRLGGPPRSMAILE